MTTAAVEVEFLGRLYPKQRAAVGDPARYAVIEASTKSGKTIGCIAWLLGLALAAREGRNFWWVAPVYSQARVAFRRMKRVLPTGGYIANESEMTICLPNGATVWFKSAEHPDHLFGEDVYAAVLDEAVRMREEAWHAIRTTLTATQGPARIISNVKGRRNWAYRLARRAEAGEPEMAYHKIVAADAVAAGVLSAGEVEDAKRQLPESVFRELYLAEPSEDEGNPFSVTAIRACVADTLEEPKQGARYIMGVDLAKSVDWSVAIVLDEGGRVVAFERWQSPWDVTMRRIQALASRYNNAGILVDETGVGDPIVEQLQRMPYL